MSAKKYEYDIKKIERLENNGMSIRGIARMLGWPECNTNQWIKRNYYKVIKYNKKRGK